ncbi:hypothetical protein [Streptococcus gallolyticus]|uniref:2'-5' RNA ligase n=1 Tax=Streptococcus gallolyticus TaxID=315405 RepID=A0A1H9LWY6_9STRE|nr:hypothetical protein [Streptococcus gallolyticus]SER15966.1 hypothetical protein SAMN04487840_101226 [Streptococcus gallolyticus]
MGKELMWVCGLLPQKEQKRLVEICKEANLEVGLPEVVFKFPLHISMKKSFYVMDFESVKNEIVSYIQKNGPLACYANSIIKYKGMIWLPIKLTNEINDWHKGLDVLLNKEFDVPIDGFDADFKPHISLFTKGSQKQINKMYKKLVPKISENQLTIRKFVVGSSKHGDNYFEV